MSLLLRGALLLALLAGCAATPLRTDPRPEPDCKVLGLNVYGTEDCEGITSQVYRSFAAFAKYVGWKSDRLFDLRASIYARHTDADYYISYDGNPQRGEAFCDGEGGLEAVVALPPHGDWSRTSLAHELAHLVEGCQSREPCDGDGDFPGHCWSARGIWLALSKANHEEYLK